MASSTQPPTLLYGRRNNPPQLKPTYASARKGERAWDYAARMLRLRIGGARGGGGGGARGGGSRGGHSQWLVVL